MLAELIPAPLQGLPLPTQTYLIRLQRSKVESRLPTWKDEPS